MHSYYIENDLTTHGNPEEMVYYGECQWCGAFEELDPSTEMCAGCEADYYREEDW